MYFHDMQNLLNSLDIMRGHNGYMDFFTTLPPMPAVTEDSNYTEEHVEEDHEGPHRPTYSSVAFVVESHGLDVKYDVCVADVVGLRLVDDQLVWGFVQSDHNQTESIVEDVWANVVAKMRLVDEQSVWGYVKLEPNQKPYILEDHNMKSVYFLLHQL
ncbi:hypothetical protein V6N11_064962 [Hibiscus sabdariffa]|uniref:Uncharacterized protein n=1 Tax=Hibiscus sabdariffa TaxID=183260 RepID=A0ABR2SIN1_9ROSI